MTMIIMIITKFHDELCWSKVTVILTIIIMIIIKAIIMTMIFMIMTTFHDELCWIKVRVKSAV